MIATGAPQESRIRALGEKPGKGKKLAAALREISTATEGVEPAHHAFRPGQVLQAEGAASGGDSGGRCTKAPA